jgi:hypothetical protein
MTRYLRAILDLPAELYEVCEQHQYGHGDNAFPVLQSRWQHHVSTLQGSKNTHRGQNRRWTAANAEPVRRG